jgi:Flp pilus assembly protein TadD
VMAGGRRYLAIVLALASATSLAGCQKTTASLDSAALSTASTGPASYEATAALGAKWEKNPSDINTGMAYANALESIGQTPKQLDVLRKLSSANPGNTKLAGLYGRKLLTAGMSREAVPVLELAATDPAADWRIRSALGSAYDQQGLYARARSEYQTILGSDPSNLAVLNNLGMSYALEGNLKQSEATLRKADALPRSKTEPRIRQNLALVVGLQGRFDEASTLASQDLPPEQVKANMAYLQKMLSQPNTWQQLSESSEG